jgi:hypothetical protein
MNFKAQSENDQNSVVGKSGHFFICFNIYFRFTIIGGQNTNLHQ